MNGDLNGDGLDDLVVGAAYASFGAGTYSGSTYVIFGQTGTSFPATGGLLETYADGIRGIRVDGPLAGARLGNDVALADINGDGCDDLLMSAVNPGGDDYAFVVYGGKAR